jgi:phage nucleotide-binding protein
MALKITSIKEEIKDNGVKILVHGGAGTGKTVLSCTTGVSTLLINAEGGLLSVAEAPDFIQTTKISTFSDLEDVYDYLVGTDHDFQWVCLDSISEIAEVVLHQEMQGAKDARQAYGELATTMIELLKKFRDLKNINVYMSCKQTRQEDEDTKVTVYRPALAGKRLTNEIAYLFDEVFSSRVFQSEDEDGNQEEVYLLQTNRDAKYECKDRSGCLEMFEQPNLENILFKIKDGIDFSESEQEDEEEEEEQEEDASDSYSNEKVSSEDSILDDDDDDDPSEFIREEEEQEEEEQEEQEDEEEEIISKKIMYWKNSDGEVLKTEKGDDISALESDEDISQITKMAYLKASK